MLGRWRTRGQRPNHSHTYLRFAEAVNRRDLKENGTKLTELLEGFLVSNSS
jgi:hypothetical protein